ncbi:hypothetical protein [Nesterenkonia haasae]|uniref:hypothetical protein n=1 Tax=Nesterenkonia haasae TaxID=2587813 RepID=UPI0013916147|nr:hypothetical protein [Nesterenkonia haasae]NDK30203.1 hypothetical protein [Nesterenkonia haasae]
MRNNMFREVLKRSSGLTEKKVKKKVGHLDWPNSTTKDDWDTKREKLSFVPDVILDRIALTQPFRDKLPDGSPPSADWMRQGGVQSSRKEANDDKHERNTSLAVTLTCDGGVRANYSFRRIAQWQRDLLNSPGDGEPIFCLKTGVECVDPVHVYEVAAHLVVPNPSVETQDRQPWILSSRNLWHQLVENLWIFHVVLAGREIAGPITGPLHTKFESLWGYGDMRYQLSSEGAWVALESPNPFRELHELAKAAHKWISSIG